jgi:hypothetical protein
MCQIASARRRASSTWATSGRALFADARFRVRVALAVAGMRAAVGGGLDQRPTEIGVPQPTEARRIDVAMGTYRD